MNKHYLERPPSKDSSSSGSIILIPDAEIEKRIRSRSYSPDLFDQLIDEEHPNCEEIRIIGTIKHLNLSPRSQSHAGCKCVKIDCLKMYCECFSKGRLCN